MEFDGIAVELRKQQKNSQKNLTDKISTHRNLIRVNERREVVPSNEIALKIAGIRVGSFDYLTDKTYIKMEKDTQKRVLNVSEFGNENLNNTFSVIDVFIAKKINQLCNG